MPGARSSWRSIRPGPLYGVAGTGGWVSRAATSSVARTPVAFSTALSLAVRCVGSHAQPGQVGRHPVQVVGVVHADVQLDQAAGGVGTTRSWRPPSRVVNQPSPTGARPNSV